MFLFKVIFLCSIFILASCSMTKTNNNNFYVYNKNNSITKSNKRLNALLSVKGPNVLPIYVSTGLHKKTSCSYVNMPCTTIKICYPSKRLLCQTIKNILVDTGSTGLRIYSSKLKLNLPEFKENGKEIGICTFFGIQNVTRKIIWGHIATAKLMLGKETTPAIPIEIIDRNFYQQYSKNSKVQNPACGKLSDDEKTLMKEKHVLYNGILGVGFSKYDLIDYYYCSSNNCSVKHGKFNNPIVNPITTLKKDNNGIIFVMPTKDAVNNGKQGKLILGIQTRKNNTEEFGVYKAYSLCSWCLGYINEKVNGNISSVLIDSGTNFIYYNTNKKKNNKVIKIKFIPNDPEVTRSVIYSYLRINSVTKNNLPAVNFNVLKTENNNIDSIVLGFPWFYGKAVGIIFRDKNSAYGSGPAYLFNDFKSKNMF